MPFALNGLELGKCICLMTSNLSCFFREILCTLSGSYLKPEFMCKYKDHVRFPYHETLDEDGNLKYTDLMISKWLKESEIMIKI